MPMIIITEQQARWAAEVLVEATRADDDLAEIAAARIVDAFNLCQRLALDPVLRCERFMAAQGRR